MGISMGCLCRELTLKLSCVKHCRFAIFTSHQRLEKAEYNSFLALCKLTQLKKPQAKLISWGENAPTYCMAFVKG